MKYKVDTHPNLFEECLDIANDVNRLKVIVQNNMEITQEEVDEWEEMVKERVKRLWDWYKRVKDHVTQTPVA